MPEYRVTHKRSESFLPLYERKPDNQEATHYCPGCGHSIIHRLVAEVIDELGIRERAIGVPPAGCAAYSQSVYGNGR